MCKILIKDIKHSDENTLFLNNIIYLFLNNIIYEKKQERLFLAQWI